MSNLRPRNLPCWLLRIGSISRRPEARVKILEAIYDMRHSLHFAVVSGQGLELVNSYNSSFVFRTKEREKEKY